uniref:BURP domain-containing protein 3 n=1 Tax=Anthurium amnicola TaxID=1678845 RepID=A0A1D1XUX1_9ARAE
MNASFDRGLTGDRFLHREVAETIPFSSKEIQEILRRFAVPLGFALANKFEYTIRTCEMAPTPSEKKLCATPLESMVEFVISTLGTKDLQTLTTATRKGAPTQLYTVQSWTVVPTPNWMATACHVQKYPCTVFNCHGIPQTKPYVLKMVGEDGTLVEAATLCHLDTSEWSLTFYALRLLKVRPGETTVCHLLPDGDIVWFPRSATKTADAAI